MISGHFAEIAAAPTGHHHPSAALYHPSLAPQQISVRQFPNYLLPFQYLTANSCITENSIIFL